MYLVEIEVDNENGKLILGSASDIAIEIEKKEKVLSIPKSAVLEDSQGKYVFIEKNNRAFRRNIKTGIDNGILVEIIEGLKDKEKIIIKGQHFVKDKGLVTVVRGEEVEDL